MDIRKSTRLLPTIDRLKETLRLDIETGKLYRKLITSNSVKLGGLAGGIEPMGYLVVTIDAKKYKQHRVVWAMLHGRWPENEIDHINGIKTDNRPENLREATRTQNNCNCKLTKRNSSGTRGVCYYNNNKWRASITRNGVVSHLGMFSSLEEAKNAYELAAIKHKGEFRRAGA